MGKDPKIWERAFLKGLEEDLVQWDWTSLSSFEAHDPIKKAKIIAKSKGVFVGEGLFAFLSSYLGQGFKIDELLRDGARLEKGQTIARIEGPVSKILGVERTLLNLLGFVSGIATRTSELVSIIQLKKLKNPPRLTCTRKTLPFYKDLSLYAVQAGGGFPHRPNLASGILLKENHLAAVGSISKAVKNAKARSPHTLRIEVEVRSLKELEEAIEAGADGALLDHFTPTQAKDAVLKVQTSSNRGFFLEVSGNLDESNLGDHAMEGIQILSSGALTHSVRSVDYSLLIEGT